jgi:hypothetical protein
VTGASRYLCTRCLRLGDPSVRGCSGQLVCTVLDYHLADKISPHHAIRHSVAAMLRRATFKRRLPGKSQSGASHDAEFADHGIPQAHFRTRYIG